MCNKNWDGNKYEWFKPIEWNKFVKRVDKNFYKEGKWKDFWKFLFKWKKQIGDVVPSNLPDFCSITDISKKLTEKEIKKEMLNWRNIILELYKQYNDKKIAKEDITNIEEEMLYWGWRVPNEPIELIDIKKNISENYFNKMNEKILRTPFCTESLALKREKGVLKQFYFVAPAQIRKAFIEVDVNGITKTFENEDELIREMDGVVAPKRYYIAGGVSDTTRDRDEEKMSKSCIESMLKSAILGTVPLRNAHNKEWDSDLGQLVEIKMDSNDTSTLLCKFELNNFDEDPSAKKLWHTVNKGKKIGFSIGGVVENYHKEYDTELHKDITVYDSIMLKEISVTGNPSNTGTFIYAISKAMKNLTEKKKLTSAERKRIPKGKFAYVDEQGKGHLPIHDASHVRNAMARFNQTDMPSSAKAGAWRKILSAARKFGIKVKQKTTNKSFDGLSLEKFGGVNMFLDVVKGYEEFLLSQIQSDLKEHFEADEEKEDELNETLEEIDEKLEDIDEDVDTESEEPEEKGIGYDFKTLLRIISLLNDLEYPRDAKQPEKYFEEYNSLPIEAFIPIDGKKYLPHHNSDYTVNREWLMYQLKDVMDGNIWVDEDDYLEILHHLHFHVMELKETKVKKSIDETEEVNEEVKEEVVENKGEVITQSEVQEEVVENKGEVITQSEVQEEVVEDKKEETLKNKEEVEEEVVEEVKEEVQPETQEDKSEDIKDEAIKSLQEKLNQLQEKLDKMPVYKTSTSEEVIVNAENQSGEVLSELTKLKFEKSTYTLDEALMECQKQAPYSSYGLKQTVRKLFPNN